MEDTTHATKRRLEEIESEIKLLAESRDRLRKRWNNEKEIIAELRRLKEEIERVKLEADNLERAGDLSRVAELRYGSLHELNRRLREANAKLEEMQESGKMLKEEVDAEDIAEVISNHTGIPIAKMLESERSKLLRMEDRLTRRVIGQEEAVTAVSNAIRRSRAGLGDANRPIGSFLFLGTTGVGKTEMARALAEFLFDDENSIVRIDMSEYMEKFSVSRLIGAPPGYVGYDEGGQLTEAVRRKPYSVVLLDEIEKANSDVFNVLLQALDDGRLTDGKGRTVNFKNTIIIMTSNLGTELIQARMQAAPEPLREEALAALRPEMLEELRKRMRPEFLNRIDEIVIFKPLGAESIRKIAELQLDIIKKKVHAEGYSIEFTPAAISWLSNLGYDLQYGARPLKRAIQKHIVDPLAMRLLEADFAHGDKIIVDAREDGKFTFERDDS
ncbi:MAG: AAA family ATPase [Chloroflexota bacterium]